MCSSDLEKLDLLRADNNFRSFNPILIYFTAPLETLLKRIKKDQHEHIDTDLLRKTLIEFEKYYLTCPYQHKIKVDTSKNTQEEIVNILINFIENVENK